MNLLVKTDLKVKKKKKSLLRIRFLKPWGRGKKKKTDPILTDLKQQSTKLFCKASL